MELHPSTELIPDEYKLNGSECIHVFAPHDFVQTSEQFLKKLGMKLRRDQIHKLDNRKHVIGTLEKVSYTREKEESMLLLMFWGISTKNGAFEMESKESLEFHEIWSTFCNKRWRNTPKVFMLNVIERKSGTQVDSAEMPSEYRTPNEGDILVIFKKNSDAKESKSFIEELGKMIDNHGNKEDIVSLITAVQVHRFRPIIISTMLKKLFVLPSEHRGHHYDLHSNNKNILDELEKIQDLLKFKTFDAQHSSNVEDGRKNRRSESTGTPERRRSSQNKQMIHPNTNTQRRKSSATKKPWIGSGSIN